MCLKRNSSHWGGALAKGLCFFLLSLSFSSRAANYYPGVWTAGFFQLVLDTEDQYSFYKTDEPDVNLFSGKILQKGDTLILFENDELRRIDWIFLASDSFHLHVLHCDARIEAAYRQIPSPFIFSHSYYPDDKLHYRYGPIPGKGANRIPVEALLEYDERGRAIGWISYSGNQRQGFCFFAETGDGQQQKFVSGRYRHGVRTGLWKRFLFSTSKRIEAERMYYHSGKEFTRRKTIILNPFWKLIQSER